MRSTYVEVRWGRRVRGFFVLLADHGAGLRVLHRIALSRGIGGRKRWLDWERLPLLLVMAITAACKVQSPWQVAQNAPKP